jgi:hypothetical protein
MTREVQAVTSIVGRVVDDRGTSEAHYIKEDEPEHGRHCGVP